MKIFSYWAASKTALYFAVLLCIVTIVFIIARYKRTQNVLRLLVGRSMHHLLSHYSPVRFVLRTALLCFASLCIAVMVCRPQGGERLETVSQQGRDVLIALDISKSMLATDLKPTRLEYAKQKIAQLVYMLSGDRCGLIIFSGKATVYCPLTYDYQALESFLSLIDVEVLSSGTTNIEQALSLGLDVFLRAPDRSSKLLVVFTDGEDFSSNLAGIQAHAKQEGVHLVTVGVGTQVGSPIPIIDAKTGRQTGHMKDQEGKIIISRLDERILKNLAADLGGMYVQLSDNESDIESILSYIKQFERDKTDEYQNSRFEDYYPLMALGAFICLCLEWIL